MVACYLTVPGFAILLTQLLQATFQVVICHRLCWWSTHTGSPPTVDPVTK